MPIDKKEIKKAIDLFENDKFTDAKEILSKEIKISRNDFLKDKLGLKEDIQKELIKEAKVVIQMKPDRDESSENFADEFDATLVRGGVTGNPNFDNMTITIDKKDLNKAKNILNKGIYKNKYKIK